MMKNSQFNEKGWEKLTAYLQNCVTEGVFPGADFALVSKDDIKICRVGYRQIVPEKEINDKDTLWDLASVSKELVTTTCILKLIEEGAITLKTKIADILPDIDYKDMTIRQCVSHTSGLPADVAGYKTMSREELLEVIKHVPYLNPPGTKVVYSDINFILLGQVIAKLKGSLDGYAKEVMFDPLEMKHTCYNPTEAMKMYCAAYEDIAERGGVIRGVVHDGKAFKLGGVSGHAGVFSTIEDVAQYAQMLLNDGMYHGHSYFHPVTIDLLRKCQTAGLNEKRSIGWILSDANYALGDYYSEHTLYHTGFSGTCVMVDLDRKIAFVTLCNRVHPTRANGLILERRNHIHNLAYQCMLSYE